MPINPNIALGVQPIQQPNMLAQMGQVMALKAAAQDTEGYEGVKSAISGGMAPNDPRLLQYGKRGIEAYRAGGEGLIKQQEALTKSFTNAREGLGMVRTPDELLAYSVSQFSDPIIGPSLRARGLTPETVAANLQKEISTSGFENVLKKSAMGLEGWFKDQTSRRNTDVSSGASYQQAALAREKFEYDKANPQLSMAQGDTGFYLYNPRDPNSARPLGMAPQAPVAAPAQLPPVANNLMLTQPTAPAANALVAPPANQPGAPTVANANALANQPTLIRPKQPIRQPVAVMKDGKAVLVPPDQAVGMTPATAFAEKTAEDKAKINRDLNTAIRNLEAVVKPGGLLEKSTGSGLGRMVDASAGFFGEATPGAVAGAQLAPIADMVLKMVP